MTESGRVTSSDVARAAGLSRATVSYVLNGDFRRIPPETRQRVLDAADALGYKPFGPARLLRGARSKLVLMVSPGLASASDAVAASIITALGEKLSETGHHLVWQLGLSAVGRAATDLAPAVVLVAPAEQETAFEELRRRFAVPVVPAFPGLERFLAASAIAQVDHLAQAGHRRLAYARPAGAEFTPTSEIRFRAAHDRATELGIPEPLVLTVPDERSAAASELAVLAASANRPTAICAYNDQVAFAVLGAAHDADIAIPATFSVVGIDDDPIGLLTIPALSTVTADLEDFISELAEQVVAIAAGADHIPGATLPRRARVVARESVAAVTP